MVFIFTNCQNINKKLNPLFFTAEKERESRRRKEEPHPIGV